MSWQSTLIEDLKRDEGFRAHPYRCTAGKLTCGYGRNLEDVGISRDEATEMLRNDVREAVRQVQIFPWYKGLTANRKRALVNMVFNLGFPTFLEFRNMLKAIESGRFDVAAAEALNSKWARQVGERAERVAELIRVG